MRRRFPPKRTKRDAAIVRNNLKLLYGSSKPPEEVPPLRTRKPSGKPLEAPILKDCLKVTQMHPLVAFAYRQNAGAYGEHFIRLGPRGIGDIIGMLKDGRFLSIEVKAPGNKPEPHQLAFMDKVNENGGVAIWTTSFSNLVEQLVARVRL